MKVSYAHRHLPKFLRSNNRHLFSLLRRYRCLFLCVLLFDARHMQHFGGELDVA